jgi:hypothetical protein
MSSKVYFAVVAIVVIFIGVFFWLLPEAPRVTEPVVVEDTQFRMSFTYPGGPDGYELVESNTSDSFLQSYVMVERSAWEAFQAAAGEVAPPTMSIFIYQQPDEEADTLEREPRPGRISRLQSWAQANAGLTAFDQIYGTPEVVEIDGVKALEYTTDGIYQQSIYLSSYRGTIYMFLGQYNRPTDVIKQDFENLMQTVRFD